VPSAGARHAFETYIYVRRVQGLEEGIWRYLPLDHRLLFEFTEAGLGSRVVEACLEQRFTGQGAATFFWSVIPARMEWRYGPAAHRVLPLDAGHVCQNLYLAAEAIGCGACAVGAYDQQALDALLRLDGEEEFVLYLAPVGRKAR
jgi:SagB-type dehydrogenase family enzyme